MITPNSTSWCKLVQPADSHNNNRRTEQRGQFDQIGTQCIESNRENTLSLHTVVLCIVRLTRELDHLSLGDDGAGWFEEEERRGGDGVVQLLGVRGEVSADGNNLAATLSELDGGSTRHGGREEYNTTTRGAVWQRNQNEREEE